MKWVVIWVSCIWLPPIVCKWVCAGESECQFVYKDNNMKFHREFRRKDDWIEFKWLMKNNTLLSSWFLHL